MGKGGGGWIGRLELTYIYYCVYTIPRWHSGKECRRCKRHRFDSWVRKIPWNRKSQPTLVFLPGKFHGQRSLVATAHGVAKCWTQPSNGTCTHMDKPDK